jgi:membrane protease YdiL (CAAX protease family)
MVNQKLVDAPNDELVRFARFRENQAAGSSRDLSKRIEHMWACKGTTLQPHPMELSFPAAGLLALPLYAGLNRMRDAVGVLVKPARVAVAPGPIRMVAALCGLAYIGVFLPAAAFFSLSKSFESGHIGSVMGTSSLNNGDLMPTEAVEQFSADTRSWQTLNTTMLVPFTEELFFRGMLLHRLLTMTSVLPACFLSSACFGLIHLSQGTHVTAAAFAHGSLYSFIYFCFPTFLVPTVLHSLNNSALLLPQIVEHHHSLLVRQASEKVLTIAINAHVGVRNMAGGLAGNHPLLVTPVPGQPGAYAYGVGTATPSMPNHPEHEHALLKCRPHLENWACDGGNGSCRGGGSGDRYRCVEGCNFDLCQSCWEGGCADSCETSGEGGRRAKVGVGCGREEAGSK